MKRAKKSFMVFLTLGCMIPAFQAMGKVYWVKSQDLEQVSDQELIKVTAPGSSHGVCRARIHGMWHFGKEVNGERCNVYGDQSRHVSRSNHDLGFLSLLVPGGQRSGRNDLVDYQLLMADDAEDFEWVARGNTPEDQEMVSARAESKFITCVTLGADHNGKRSGCGRGYLKGIRGQSTHSGESESNSKGECGEYSFIEYGNWGYKVRNDLKILFTHGPIEKLKS